MQSGNFRKFNRNIFENRKSKELFIKNEVKISPQQTGAEFLFFKLSVVIMFLFYNYNNYFIVEILNIFIIFDWRDYRYYKAPLNNNSKKKITVFNIIWIVCIVAEFWNFQWKIATGRYGAKLKNNFFFLNEPDNKSLHTKIDSEQNSIDYVPGIILK